MNANAADTTQDQHNTYNLCIVDDDPFLLDMYNLKFQAAGHTVACFTDAGSALNELRGGARFDALLLDLVMPQISGLELLKTIREENLCGDSTSLVVLSNQNQQDDIDAAESYRVDGYLVKANTLPSEVLEQVEDIIENKRAK